MSYSFRFTDVGEGLEEGEIVTWLVAVGDMVEPYQPLVSVETDKSVVDLPSPVGGRVTALHGAAGDIVKVGELMVEIDNDGSATMATTSATGPDNPSAPDAAGEGAPASPSHHANSAGVAASVGDEKREPVRVSTGDTEVRRVKTSPSTRKLAVELDVDLSRVAASGPDGRVTADDVRTAASQTTGSPPEVVGAQVTSPAASAEPFVTSAPTSETLSVVRRAFSPSAGPQTTPLRGLRKRTAEVMAQSWATIPHVSAMEEIDATELLAVRDRLRTALGASPKLTAVSFAVKAAALALQQFPAMNSSINMEEGTVTLHDRVNIGVAVATDDGLVVPVVADADRRSLRSIAIEIERLGTLARARRLTPADQKDGTFTVTNYGSFGGTWGSPIIRPPEAGILGLGAIKSRPYVVDGDVRACSTLPLVVAGDHRLVDGDVLGGFLMLVAALLGDPVRMLIED